VLFRSTGGPDREPSLGPPRTAASASGRGSGSVFDVPPGHLRPCVPFAARAGGWWIRASPGEHRARTAGNRRSRNGPVRGGRPRGPTEPDLDTHARATVAAGRGRGEGKGEGARTAVNGEGHTSPVTSAHLGTAIGHPLSGGDPVDARRTLRAEGRLRRAGRHPGDGPGGRRGDSTVRRSAKRGEPQGRQRVATHARGIGGGNRRGGAKPRGRNAEGPWQVPPEGEPPRGEEPGVDSGVVGRRRGDLWTIPGEAVQSGDRLDRRRWQVPGKAAPKVRRVAQTSAHAFASGPYDGPRRRAPVREHRRNVRRAVGKPMSHDAARVRPPISPPGHRHEMSLRGGRMKDGSRAGMARGTAGPQGPAPEPCRFR